MDVPPTRQLRLPGAPTVARLRVFHGGRLRSRGYCRTARAGVGAVQPSRPPGGLPMAEPAAPSSASKSRLTVYYVVLFAITAAVAAVVLTNGKDEHGLSSIAGG